MMIIGYVNPISGEVRKFDTGAYIRIVPVDEHYSGFVIENVWESGAVRRSSFNDGGIISILMNIALGKWQQVINPPSWAIENISSNVRVNEIIRKYKQGKKMESSK